MAAPRPKTYRYRITFTAPLPFVFRWCTDYRATDARLERASFRRKVLERTRQRVVYEDLEETSDGWAWRRHVVTLHPPNRWHSDSVGNRRTIQLDYTLRERPHGRTEMIFAARRWPALLGGPNPSSREFGRDMESSWQRFRQHLEAEYRRSTRPARGRSGGRRLRR